MGEHKMPRQDMLIKAYNLKQFFPKIARGHGSGRSGFCHNPGCETRGGRSTHNQDPLSAAKDFVFSNSGISADEE